MGLNFSVINTLMKQAFLFLLLISTPLPSQAVDMAFGRIAYVSGANALNAIIDPVTGAMTCNNQADYTCPPSGTRASFLIPGDRGQQVDMRCRRSPEISNGDAVLRVRNVMLHIGGVTEECRGTGNSIMIHTLTGNQAQDTAYLGARLRIRNGESSDLSGVFNTTNAGGQDLRIRYLFI